MIGLVVALITGVVIVLVYQKVKKEKDLDKK